MQSGKYKMITQPPRGGLREGLSFGYVDVPAVMTEKDRPFLDELTAVSLNLQKEIRKDTIEGLKIIDTHFSSGEKEVAARVYIPGTKGPHPLLMYYHGGGFAIRNIECFDYIHRYLAKNSGCVLVSVEYDLSPEAKFPVAAKQCFDGLIWARKNAGNWDADASRDAVAGDSAGGNLSAVMCLMCRDQGIEVPKKQILIYPAVDQCLKTGRESEKLYGIGYNLDFKHMVSYGRAYVKNDEDLMNPYVSPLFAENLKGMPKAYFVQAECDILIDQGLEYAKRLQDAGTEVKYKIFTGVPHDFLFFAFPESYEAYDLVCRWLRE
ncbi:MAG: alpha/beta hydrolase [Eubacteriales bacterium]|nr:alpha/beta hydrolase [Eubacteriales bacterium]